MSKPKTDDSAISRAKWSRMKPVVTVDLLAEFEPEEIK